ncbi:YraN family protein [Candidatus Parcubacteria bacterium]|nr:YraN family protein [Candidatus Parcubacteria bacterium]
MYSKKRQFGNIGENVACVFLEKHDFTIIERNYLRKWGEIDIVARKGEIIHFIEVKAVSHETQYRPEENMHPQKLRRLGRTMQTYVLEKQIEGEWQLDLVTVRIDEKNRRAQAEIIENIVI